MKKKIIGWLLISPAAVFLCFIAYTIIREAPWFMVTILSLISSIIGLIVLVDAYELSDD